MNREVREIMQVREQEMIATEKGREALEGVTPRHDLLSIGA